MPFTLCHPAALAVLPSRVRRTLPLAALAIGSMTPDFEYLLRLKPLSVWSHTVPGLIVFCLPAGLVTWIAWEQIARGPTRELLALRTEPSAWPLSIRSLVLASLAVLAGAASHLAWDSFTHSGRLGAMLVPQLEQEAWRIGSYSLRWFSVLQHLSTVAGAIVLGVWFAHERRRHGHAGVWTGRIAVLAVILAIGISVGIANAWLPRAVGDAAHPGRQALLARFVVGGMAGVGGALLTYGALRRVRAM
jgi:hypothetical protein